MVNGMTGNPSVERHIVSTEHRKLIIAKVNSADLDAVAKIFAESDATELPYKLGVRRRTLFRFHDLYMHLVESSGDIEPKIMKDVANDPLYRDVSDRLKPFVQAYDPAARSPKDAFAEEFYVWEAK
jgi:cyclase